MRLEISIPDFETANGFETTTPPDGVIIYPIKHPTRFSAEVTAVSVFIDFSSKVTAAVVAGLILTAFAKYRAKRPDYKCHINRREIRLEKTEIVRFIEEVRTEDHSDESHK